MHPFCNIPFYSKIVPLWRVGYHFVGVCQFISIKHYAQVDHVYYQTGAETQKNIRPSRVTGLNPPLVVWLSSVWLNVKKGCVLFVFATVGSLLCMVSFLCARANLRGCSYMSLLAISALSKVSRNNVPPTK